MEWPGVVKGHSIGKVHSGLDGARPQFPASWVSWAGWKW